MKKENPVVWFEIYTDDLQRARRFYEQVLDIEAPSLRRYGIEKPRFRCPGARPGYAGGVQQHPGLFHQCRLQY